MPLFHAWDGDHSSVVLDALTEADARKALSELWDNEPKRVVAMPPLAFVAEVVFRDDDDGDADVVLEPIDHTIDALEMLEDQAEAAAETCGATCDYGDEGEVLGCDLAPGHVPLTHHSHHERDGDVTWEG